ncbi:MAG TPA: DUF4349 domain-containing protein [Coriobacteriia bacterium]|nr:DUF4349 domain-containing protein [Coriobacteriia bacterium]
MDTRVARIGRWVVLALMLAGVLAVLGCGSEGAGTAPSETREAQPGIWHDGAGDVAQSEIAIAPVPPDSPGGGGVDASAVPPDERYIIRSVGIRLRVDDVGRALESVREEVAAVEGIVTAVQVSTDEDIPIYRYEATGALADGAPLRGYVTARVPADEVDTFVDAVSGLGVVQRQSEDESDVTQEHIDLSARLDTLRAQEARLRTFFEEAKNVEEMLAVERELTRVRGEIESLTAQVSFLERQSAMATVTVELAGTPPIVRPVGPDWGFGDALTQGVRGLVNTLNRLIVIVLSGLPVLVVVSAAALAVRWGLRRRRRRDSSGPQPEDTTA